MGLSYFDTANFVRRTVIALVLGLFMGVHSVHAAADNEIIPEKDITASIIVDILKSANIKAEKDDDGDVQIIANGEIFFISIGKSRIYLFTYIRCRREASKSDILELCNKINDELVLIRASGVFRDDDNRIWFDYSFPIEAGATPKQIINIVDRYSNMVRVSGKKDKKDIMY